MRIATLIKDRTSPFLSMEFFPPAEESHLPEFFATVDRLREASPLFVSVTYGAGGGKQRNTLKVTAELARRGLTVMAHLTCVGANGEDIENFLVQLEQAGVDNVLALRGDMPVGRQWDPARGAFAHASDLVLHLRKVRPELGIAVAAYPAPHPESPSYAADREFTLLKLRQGADFAITQLFFDVREYMDLVDGLRAKGMTLPVIPGILPIQSFDTLRRVLSMCGANIPGKLYLQMEEADRKGGAEAVREAGKAFALEQMRRLLDIGAPGIHLYTLNKSELCLQIAREAGLAPSPGA
ncbi:MAG: methylenetetrahydrofolate reductase [Desulfovibrio sp.]|jgi:methylenetetrahydrofolate reductase (NADPH)|nr:methylenetetrahydrofolate reductase [Desulfovibrio sp.]